MAKKIGRPSLDGEVLHYVSIVGLTNPPCGKDETACERLMIYREAYQRALERATHPGMCIFVRYCGGKKVGVQSEEATSMPSSYFLCAESCSKPTLQLR